MATLTCGYDAAGNAKTYSTIASAISAAASSGDTIEVYYSDAYKGTVWNVTSLTINKNVTVKGMLDNQQISLVGGSTSQVVVITSDCTLQNFTVQAGYGGSFGVYCATAGVSAFLGRELVIKGEYNPVQWGAGTGTFNNCVLISPLFATYIVAGTLTFNFCMTIGSIGAYAFIQTGTATVNCYNCVAAYPQTGYGFSGTIGGSNNASTDNTQPGTGGVNLRTSDPKWWKDISASYRGDDFRINTGSALAGAGVAVTGITTDIFGRTRANPPSIGPYEVWAVPTAPDAGDIVKNVTCVLVDGTTRTGTFDEAARNTDPGEANVLDGTIYKIQNVSKEGTLVGEVHTDDEVIDTAGGNYVTVAASKIKDGTSFGISQTGTYPDVDALIAKIDDLQASVDDLTIAGTSYLYAPTAAVRDVGDNDGGDYTSLSAHDESYFSVGELAGASTTLGDKLTATVTRGTSTTTQIPSLVRIAGRYQGSAGHSVTVQTYNYASSAWESHATMLSRTTDFDYVIPLGVDNHNASTGEMKLRFLHATGVTGNATHALHLDWISWEKVATAGTIGSDVARIYDLLVDVDAETDEIATTVEAIQAKTDNLPADPAATGDIPSDKIDELWRFKGLSAAKPLTATGDGITGKVLVSDDITLTITDSGVSRT